MGGRSDANDFGSSTTSERVPLSHSEFPTLCNHFVHLIMQVDIMLMAASLRHQNIEILYLLLFCVTNKAFIYGQ